MAEDCAAPCAGYEISVELQNDLTFAADPSSGTSNIFEPSISAGLFVLPAPNLGLVGTVTTEPLDDPAFGESGNLSGIGSYIEELYVVVEADAANVRFGKFDPLFSLAGEFLPGINSTELVDNIDADERLGVEADVEFEAIGLNHRLAAAAFTTDRSVLAGSFFTSRERTSLADGGAGNTTGVSSLAAVLSGCDGADAWDCYFDGQFGYRIAFRYQETDRAAEGETGHRAEAADERAYLAGATRNLSLGDQNLSVLGEVAFLENFEGGPGDALFVTGSAAVELGSLFYVATYSQQRNYFAGAPDTLDHLADFEAIYVAETELPFAGSAWEIGAAYTYASAENETRHIFSLQLTLDLFGEF